MSSDSRCCERCGGLIGRGGVHVEVRPSGEDGEGKAWSVDACKECGRSLARWLERGGRDRAGPAGKPAPEGRKSPRRRGRFRPSREHVALAAVIILCLLFCFYFLRSSPAE